MNVNIISKRHVILPSPAKINTFLHVYKQRADGYHDLETYFQLIDLADIIEIKLIADKHIIIDNPSISNSIDSMQNDLCYKAAKQLWNPLIHDGIHIKVLKNIPDGAGLGGGSSNAATVLLALNQMLDCGYSKQQLQEIGLKLGSDVPIFIYGRSSFATGRGEIFTNEYTELALTNQKVIIIQPNIKLSTKAIFTSKYLTKRCKESKIHRTEKRLGDNDFLPAVMESNLSLQSFNREISKYFTVYLTGTGSCFYALVDDIQKTVKLINEIPIVDLSVDMIYPVNCIAVSPLLDFNFGEWPSG